jgi:hypothetical protein
MLGAGVSLPTTWISSPDLASKMSVAAAVRTWFSSTNARVMTLGGLVDGAFVQAAFPDGSSVVEATAPFVRLTGTDAYLASRSKNFRSNIRKASHRADRDALRYRHLDPIEASSGLVRLRELHVARWGDTRFLAVFDRFSAAAMRGLRWERCRCMSSLPTTPRSLPSSASSSGPHLLLSGRATPAAMAS